MASGDLKEGDLLGRFVVEGVLGRGGIGVVYKVLDPKSKMPYAAKVLNRSAAGQRDFVKRFKTEAKTAKRLVHMNIVHVFLLKKWGDTYFYVMEHVDGNPLEDLMAAGAMPMDRTLAILRDVAAGLDHIHSLKYVHRDLKPGNVLVRGDSHIKLIDFGLAQKAGRVKRTNSGHVMGTAKYMAPELIDGTVAGPETDIYSLGVMAYEMLAGRAPFVADHTSVLMDMHLYVRPKPLLDAVPGIDRNLSLFVDRMLVKKPSNRASSAKTVHSWLDFYLTNGWFADTPKRF